VKTVTVVLDEEPVERVCLMCGKPAVVLLNRTPACTEHLDTVMAQAFKPLHELLGRLVWEKSQQ
jgi:hypothetical protein